MLDNNYIFREFYYVTILVKERFDNKVKNCCLNIDCSLFIVNKAYMHKTFSLTEIRQLITFLFVKDIDNVIYSFNEYVVVNLFVNDYIKKNKKKTVDYRSIFD